MTTNWVVNDRNGRVVGIYVTKRAATAALRAIPGGYIERIGDGSIVRI